MIVFLLINLLAALGAMALLWLVALRLRDVSFIDAVWPIGMVFMAWLTLARLDPFGPRVTLILILVTLWGLRLGGHLFLRWWKSGEDPRYAKMLAKAKNWPLVTLTKVFLLQGVLFWLVSLPAQIGIALPYRELGVIAAIGAALTLIGIAFESVGDWQLTQFRTDPENKGKVMDRGLWRYTRHPNYFGDACVWWGLWLIAAETLSLWALASIVGPIFLTFTLIRWSGAALLEHGLKKSRPDYANYIDRTSAFIPWPPKR